MESIAFCVKKILERAVETLVYVRALWLDRDLVLKKVGIYCVVPTDLDWCRDFTSVAKRYLCEQHKTTVCLEENQKGMRLGKTTQHEINQLVDDNRLRVVCFRGGSSAL